MKKYFVCLFTLLAAVLLLPIFVDAASISIEKGIQSCDGGVTKNNYKYTTCKFIITNGDSKASGNYVWDLVFTVQDPTTVVDFKVTDSSILTVDESNSKTDATTGTVTKRVSVSSLQPGDNEVGEVVFKAKVDVKDCGGAWSLKQVGDTGTGETQTGGNTNPPKTGASTPYIALGIGTVGVVAVLATSKKKTKFYKI